MQEVAPTDLRGKFNVCLCNLTPVALCVIPISDQKIYKYASQPQHEPSKALCSQVIRSQTSILLLVHNIFSLFLFFGF